MSDLERLKAQYPSVMLSDVILDKAVRDQLEHYQEQRVWWAQANEAPMHDIDWSTLIVTCLWLLSFIAACASIIPWAVEAFWCAAYGLYLWPDDNTYYLPEGVWEEAHDEDHERWRQTFH